MSTKRVLFLGACVALAASGADARALLQDPGAVAADPEDLACVACKKFVADGEEYINDPSTLDQVSEEIKELCEDQAGERAEMCERLMQDAVRYALGVVNDDVTPEGACGAVGFCPAPEPAFAFAPSPAMRETIERATALSPSATGEDTRASSPADCLKCKFGVEALHEAVTSNDTVAALLLKADDACEKYAASFDLAATCEAAVATYAPEVVRKATEFLADAEKVCAHIGMCPPPNKRDPTRALEAGDVEENDARGTHRDGRDAAVASARARRAAIRGTVLSGTQNAVADGLVHRGGVVA